MPTIKESYGRGGDDFIGIPTGFSVIDDWTGGMQPDQMWIVGASTSVGKTSWVLSVAKNAATLDHWTIYYSLEMSGEAMTARLLSSYTDIPPLRMRRGMLSADEMAAIERAAASLRDLKLLIVDRSFTSAQLCEHALRIADKTEVKLAVVDYAQILQDENASSVQRVAGISQNIRNLARPEKLNAPVILVSQLSRAATSREDKTPLASDLKDSSQLEQDAEVVVLPYRPFLNERDKEGAPPQLEEEALLIVAKNRNGPTGATKAKFFPKKMRWEQQPFAPAVPQTLKAKVQAKR